MKKDVEKVQTKPIIALDVPTQAEALAFLEKFGTEKLFVKIGMELFYSAGPELIQKVKEKGHWIFLDLKLHDIPNTVYRAMKRLAALGVDMVNVHAAGGKEMMAAALEGLENGTPEGQQRPSIIAVTQLTSTDESQMQREQLIQDSLENSVVHYAKLAQESGLDGVVCSVHEAGLIAEACGEQFLKVTPGIRLADSATDDQKRIATPHFARQNGSTHIVVGRAITKAAQPVKAYETVQADWEGLTN